MGELVSFIELKDRETYRPVDMLHVFLHDVAVVLPYKLEWRWEEADNDMMHGSAIASYGILS